MKQIPDFRNQLVRLSDERLRHILEHPEMEGLEAKIEETLRSPAFVMLSRTDSRVSLSYRYYFGTTVGDKWLCVVVKYGDEDAFAITAYLSDKIKPGEQLWPPK